MPEEDKLANRLRGVLGEQRAYPIIRRKNIVLQRALFVLSQRFPTLVRRLIRAVNAKQLEGSGCDVDVHFNPTYDPWDQRLCAVPNADLFRTLRAGDASIVTDQINSLTETGIRMQSAQELAADIVVTATGLNILGFGGIEFAVDGAPVSLPDTIAYEAMMLSGLPNYVCAIGYTNASWTLKVDLVCKYFCRLIGHVDLHGYDACVPVAPEGGMERRPLLDFKAGYVLRAVDALPKQGTQAPRTVSMSYTEDARTLRTDSLEDDAMRFFAAESRLAEQQQAERDSRCDDRRRGSLRGPGPIRLCYRTHDDPGGEPLVLIAGLGQQLISWPEPLIERLAAAGYRVLRFDNRDAGRSSRIAIRPPGPCAS